MWLLISQTKSGTLFDMQIKECNAIFSCARGFEWSEAAFYFIATSIKC